MWQWIVMALIVYLLTYVFAVECWGQIAMMLLMSSVLSVSRYISWSPRTQASQATGGAVAWWLNSYVRHSLLGQAGVLWSVAYQPAMRPSDVVAIAGKPFMDERLAETRQPVCPWTGRVGVNTYPYWATYCVPCWRADGLFTSLYILYALCLSWLVASVSRVAMSLSVKRSETL